MQTKQKTDVSFGVGCMNRPSDCWITILAAAPGGRVYRLDYTDTRIGIVWPGFVTADGPSGATPFDKGEADEDYREFTGARAYHSIRTSKLKETKTKNNHDSILLTGFTKMRVPGKFYLFTVLFEGK